MANIVSKEEKLNFNDINGQFIITNSVPKDQVELIKLIISSVMFVIIIPIALSYIIELIVLIIQREPGDYRLFPFIFLLGLVGSLSLAILSIVFSFAWELKGTETITISDDKLIRDLSPAPLINKSKEYILASIADIKPRNQQSGFRMNTTTLGSWGYIFGRIKGNVWFIHDGFPATIGCGLSNDDITKIIKLIEDKLSKLAPRY